MAEPPDTAVFDVAGFELEIPEAQLTDPLRDALESGRFEHSETRALVAHLRGDDRVLDLGAGCGFLTMQAAARVGEARVLAVEANATMLGVIASNIRRNGGAPITVRHGAVVPGDGGGTVPFYAQGGFWAGSLRPPGRSVDVPALGFNGLLDAHRPTVVIVDIEGGEEHLFEDPLPGFLRAVICELHPKVYGPRGVQRIFDGLSRSGLVYSPTGSRGRTVAFKRVTDR